MGLTGTPFPVELWRSICNYIEAEYFDADARESRSITSALASLSRTCRPLHCILQPVLYTAPAIVGMPSLEFFFRTVVTRSDLASTVQTVKWYEGDSQDVYRWVQVDDEGLDLGDEFHSRYSEWLHELDIDQPDGPTRGFEDWMHEYAQLLPLFLPNLQTLDYRREPLLNDFEHLSEYCYRSQKPLKALRDLRIRAQGCGGFSLRSIASLLRVARDTLENLHLEGPTNVNEVGEWPPKPELQRLKKLSVLDGRLGDGSFIELLYHTPHLEEFSYHSGCESPEDMDNEERLTWATLTAALEPTQDTLKVLDLGLYPEYLAGYEVQESLEFPWSFKDFSRLHTVSLTQATVFREDTEFTDGKLLAAILPKTLKHFELRDLRADFVGDVLGLAVAAQTGDFPRLATVRLRTAAPEPRKDGCDSDPVLIAEDRGDIGCLQECRSSDRY
ncbi:hypothetical protein JX265_005502 [Neoarthrinium moseri]|uniref:Uncharacterized protein n=1 Tax=Neoarthrinium moseri TaxID=1658444 RepID=A0A9P9WPA8_9PEZI|nr:hypothetical protein JX265_005502 [Neoarthrinium moseri]